MKQENSKSVSVVNDAVTALKEGGNNAIFQFMEIAENIAKNGNVRMGRSVRDRVLYQLAQNQELTEDKTVQEVLAVLNDAIDQARGRVQIAFKKSAKAKKRPQAKKPEKQTFKEKEQTKKLKAANEKMEQEHKETMPGVFREVTVVGLRGTRAQAELFFGYSNKGKRIVRVYAIKSGDKRILIPGSTYQIHGLNIPQLLNEAISRAGIRFSEVMEEAGQKRNRLKAAA